jgi:hypothetical protein
VSTGSSPTTVGGGTSGEAATESATVSVLARAVIRRRRGGWPFGAAAPLLALVPIVVAAVRAMRDHWVPVGDDAIISIRTHDVLGSGQLPMVGTWSGKSWYVGFHMHHPGPMFFDVLAIPARLIPGPNGLIVGNALLNSAAVLGVFLVARRRGGQLLAVTAMAVTGALAWSMGSAVLAEPWNVSALLLPFLCFCLLAWSVACNDVVCLPWAAFVGSLLIQSNLAFLPLVLGLLAVSGLLVVLERRRGIVTATAKSWRRYGARFVVVGLVCWVRPIIEQLFGEGYGNMTRLARSSVEPSPTMGPGTGIRAVADIVSLPPWWGRPTYAREFSFSAFGNPLPSLAAAILSLAVLFGLLAWLARLARRRDDRTLLALLGVAAGLVVIALVTANFTPVDGNYGTTAYQVRWLWSVGAFVTFALASAVVRRVDAGDRGRTIATSGLVALTGFFTVLNLPASDQGTTAPTATIPVARDITREVAKADLDGPLLVDCDESLFDGYCEAVLAELQRHDISFVMRDVVAVHQVGSKREWDGHNAKSRLVVAVGDHTLDQPPEAEQIALHRSLTDKEQLELFYLREEFKQAALEGRLRLNEDGGRVVARGDLPSVTGDPVAPQFDSQMLFDLRTTLFGDLRRDLVAMARQDLLDLDDALAKDLDRYADLQTRWDEQTVAVFIEPLPEPGRVS